MDNTQLTKYFPGTYHDDPAKVAAYRDLEKAGKELAETINSLLIESQAKGDILGRLFRVIVDSELAIRMDGITTTTPIIVMKQ